MIQNDKTNVAFNCELNTICVAWIERREARGAYITKTSLAEYDHNQVRSLEHTRPGCDVCTTLQSGKKINVFATRLHQFHIIGQDKVGGFDADWIQRTVLRYPRAIVKHITHRNEKGCLHDEESSQVWSSMDCKMVDFSFFFKCLSVLKYTNV